MNRLRTTKLAILIPAGLLLLGTVYTGILAIAWGVESARMTSTTNDLIAQRADQQATVDDLLHQVSDLTTEVDLNLDLITELANDRATADDDQTLYGAISLALGDCVRERDTLSGYVKSRSLYTPASLRAYQNDVDEYCASLHSIYAELVAGVVS